MNQYSINKHMIKSLCCCAIFFILVFSTCKKWVEVPAPTTQLVSGSVFNDDATAQAAMASPYFKLSDIEGIGGGYNITLAEAFYADELASYITIGANNSSLTQFYFNNVTPQNGIVATNWSNCYKVIYECNRILEGLNKSTNVSQSVKNQLSGEALFLRSFCHFYLVNLFGDVPYVHTSDYTINTTIFRTPVSQVYQGIIADLIQAKSLLTDNYPSTERVRVNKGAATALLARIYLYMSDWTNAEAQATEIINKTAQYKIPLDLNTVFLKTSEEAIWQLLPKGGLRNYTTEGSLFILLAGPPTTCALRDELYQSFESGDLRKTKWTGSVTSASGLTTWYFPYKYKQNAASSTGAEYSMVMRLAEQYLIRAEARARQNKLIGSNSAASDINIIRNRAGLPNTAATTHAQLLAAVELERRAELFTEWGHRFFDLKRWGRLDAALAQPVKLNWNTTDALLPIPQSEILINGNLTQNPGY